MYVHINTKGKLLKRLLSIIPLHPRPPLATIPSTNICTAPITAGPPRLCRPISADYHPTSTARPRSPPVAPYQPVRPSSAALSSVTSSFRRLCMCFREDGVRATQSRMSPAPRARGGTGQDRINGAVIAQIIWVITTRCSPVTTRPVRPRGRAVATATTDAPCMCTI